ncbi:D-amino-acid oxidase [Hyaloraphidium curvatum]|nr:D-amino-acid oxidase [Hyaloraphidium curvatum]
MSADPPLRIAVLGAGVVGLTLASTLALHLRALGRAFSLRVLGTATPSAPGRDPRYASPVAGANWHSFALDDEAREQKWDGATFRVVHGLLARFSGRTHVRRMPAIDVRSKKAAAEGAEIDSAPSFPEAPWFRTFCPGFRALTPEELERHGGDAGYAFETVCFDSPRYLLFLEGLVKELGGEVIAIDPVKHVDEVLVGHPAAGGEQPDAVFVCTGIGARELGGIEDADVYPTRGQVVVVRAPDVKATCGRIAEWSYVIPRGDGTVILGGTYQAGDWNLVPDPATAASILERTATLPRSIELPNLGPVEFIRDAAGLRPTRRGGTRVGRVSGKLYACYGHGGAGYQSSWGTCLDAANAWLEAAGLGTATEEEVIGGLEAVLDR